MAFCVSESVCCAVVLCCVVLCDVCNCEEVIICNYVCISSISSIVHARQGGGVLAFFRGDRQLWAQNDRCVCIAMYV
jgi:hypothetical protein